VGVGEGVKRRDHTCQVSNTWRVVELWELVAARNRQNRGRFFRLLGYPVVWYEKGERNRKGPRLEGLRVRV